MANNWTRNSAVTLLLPFESGKVYLIEADSNRQKSLYDSWSGFFASDQGKIRDFSYKTEFTGSPPDFHFPCPLGLMVEFKWSLENSHKILASIQESPSKKLINEEQEVECKVCFFTNGVACFVLRTLQILPVNDLNDLNDFDEWRDRVRMSKTIRKKVEYARRHYLKLMDIWAPNQYSLQLFKILPERTFLEEPDIPYGDWIFYSNNNELYDDFITFKNVKVRVNEEATYVSGDWARFRDDVETTVILSIAAWHVLYVIDSFICKFMQNALFYREYGRFEQTDIDSLRDYYMEVAKASRPFRYTFKGQYLAIMEGLHKVWGTDQLWRDFSDRIREFASHSADQERTSIQTLGITLSCLTFITATNAVANLANIYNSKSHDFNTFSLIHYFILVLIFILIGWLVISTLLLKKNPFLVLKKIIYKLRRSVRSFKNSVRN